MECEMCHGADGSGKTDLAKDMQLKLADWGDPATLGSRSDGEIFDIIRKGTDKMPAEAPDRAKNDDVWNLVIYIRALAKKLPVPDAAPANAPAAPVVDAPAAPPANP
jgi:mono/diheme cytochrome c family protein